MSQVAYLATNFVLELPRCDQYRHAVIWQLTRRQDWLARDRFPLVVAAAVDEATDLHFRQLAGG